MLLAIQQRSHHAARAQIARRDADFAFPTGGARGPGWSGSNQCDSLEPPSVRTTVQVRLLTGLVALICGCGESSPEPTVTGTLLCDAHSSLLWGNADDPEAAQAALEQLVIEGLHGRSFLRRVADREHVDAAELARSLTVRRRKDSRVIEVGVAFADRALALRVCNAILDTCARSHDFTRDVRVIDHCSPRR